jgi:Rrf2 family protein
MISQRAKYALKALLSLARATERGQPVPIRDIAQRDKIPQSFLEHILLDLKRHGLVASRRGKEGGYILLRSPEQISLGQVLRLVDGPVAPLPCLSRTAYRRCGDCADETTCTVRHIFTDVYEATVNQLEQTTLHDALHHADGIKVLDEPTVTYSI